MTNKYFWYNFVLILWIIIINIIIIIIINIFQK